MESRNNKALEGLFVLKTVKNINTLTRNEVVFSKEYSRYLPIEELDAMHVKVHMGC